MPQRLSRLQCKLFPLALILLVASAAPAFCQQPLVVFLVRHAEKVDNSQTSELSAAGKTRAAALATALRNAEIEFVHSTDFVRTKKTASPIAAQSETEIELYDAGDLAGFAEQLKAKGGRHLIVGHSNTTPKLAKVLGGEPGAKIEEQEYDRLYIITIGKDGVASTVLIRYGE